MADLSPLSVHIRATKNRRPNFLTTPWTELFSSSTDSKLTEEEVLDMYRPGLYSPIRSSVHVQKGQAYELDGELIVNPEDLPEFLKEIASFTSTEEKRYIMTSGPTERSDTFTLETLNKAVESISSLTENSRLKHENTKVKHENARLKAELDKLKAFFPQDNSPTLGGY